MDQIFPKVFYKDEKYGIEVMNFSRLLAKLNSSVNHDPFDLHRIEFFIILVVTRSSYEHFLDFTSYKLTKGCALFVAKNQVHHFNRELENSEGYGIIFDSKFIDKYHFLSGKVGLNRLFNYHIETPFLDSDECKAGRIIELAAQLYEEYNEPQELGKSEILGSLLFMLLIKAERVKEAGAIHDYNPQWLEMFIKFKDLLEKEYMISRSSRAYAAKLLVSYKFLNDVIKSITGKTAKAFIDNFVVTEIKRYLVTTSLSVKEIGFETGFDDSANMVKFFKHHEKITPLRFRNTTF